MIQVKNMRQGMFRYSCNRGFKLIGTTRRRPGSIISFLSAGSKKVYCFKSGWNLKTAPVCALTSEKLKFIFEITSTISALITVLSSSLFLEFSFAWNFP